MNKGQLRLIVPATHSNKVGCIKAIRMLTGLGLKEAKDISDRVGENIVGLDLRYYGADAALYAGEYETNARFLRQEGYQVGNSVHIFLQELRILGARALEQGEDELADEILQMVLAHKLKNLP